MDDPRSQLGDWRCDSYWLCLIWKFCPKKKAHGLVSVESAVAIAVGVYNDGAKTFLDILKALNLSVGLYAQTWAKKQDAERIKNAQREAQESSHESRIARREARLRRDEQQTEAEGFPYQAGAY